MLQGTSLTDIAQRLITINERKKDVVVDVSNLAMANDSNLAVINGETHSFQPTTWAHQQIASYSDVPKAYYDRLKSENKTLLASNVNHGFIRNVQQSKENGKNEARLVRLLDGNVRAFLSSRYRILDSFDMLTAVLPLMDESKMKVVSSEITERRLFIKALSQKAELTTEVKKGDAVQYGLMISTSDVGSGSVRVEPMIFRLICTNGMISPDSTIRKFHIGKDLSTMETNFQEILSDSTKQKADAAFWATVKDVVAHSMKTEIFENVVDRLRIASNEPIKNQKLDRVIDLTMKALNVPGELIKNNILMELCKANDMTRWGLVNAFTAAAHTTEGINYETSIELERAGGKILDLPSEQWRNISATA